jgi:cytochrome c
MLDIKSGARANGNSAAMKGVMHLVSDAEIKELAAYIATMK